MNWRGVVVAALLMGAAVSCSGQVSGPAHKTVGLWGWVKGVVTRPVTWEPTGTGYYRSSFVQGGTNWVCFTWLAGTGTIHVTGVVTGELLVVAGGGNGGASSGGGGGAGEYYHVSGVFTTGNYSVSVGAATQNSSFAEFVCVGGGDGGQYNQSGLDGGSGGGSGRKIFYASGSSIKTIGSGNGGAVGSTITYDWSGGGGGAGSAGQTGSFGNGGSGGSGITNSISGTARLYACGGGGYGGNNGGLSGDGVGLGGTVSVPTGSSASANTGSGGCGSNTGAGGSGGSGVVIFRVTR